MTPLVNVLMLIYCQILLVLYESGSFHVHFVEYVFSINSFDYFCFIMITVLSGCDSQPASPVLLFSSQQVLFLLKNDRKCVYYLFNNPFAKNS